MRTKANPNPPRNPRAKTKAKSKLGANVPSQRSKAQKNSFSHPVKSKKQRRDMETKYRDLIVQSQESILIVDAAGKIEFANQSTESLFGYDSGELVNKAYDILIPNHLREAHLEYHGRYIKKPKPRAAKECVNILGVKKNGATFPAEVSLSPVKTKSGLLIKCLIRDITEKKRNESERQKAQSLLFAEDVIDSLKSTIAVLDSEGVILAVNEPWRRFADENNLRNSSYGIGVNYLDVCRKAGQDYKVICEGLESVMRGEQDHFSAEYPCDSPSEKRWFIMNVSKLKGPRVGAVVSHDTITEAKAAKERELLLAIEKAARLEAENANRIKDEFLAVLSHELRTPLCTILAWAQLLKMGKVEAEKAKEAVSIIEQNAKVQNQLIDDLLDITRIQSGKLGLDLREIDPVETVRAAIDSVQVMAAKKSIPIEVRADSNIGYVSADRARLQQIFWNILTNAIKFTSEAGKISVSLNRKSFPTGDFFQAKIADTGKGISASFLPHVFEKFKQADSSTTRVHGGLGLGLAIVQNLVQMQGGSVLAESDGEGLGSVFTVIFPLRTSMMPTGIASSMWEIHSTEKNSPLKLEGIRILIVDDDVDVLGAIEAALQSFGAQVRKAVSASEAIELFSRERPDIVLSDIGMPKEDGYSLIRKIRAIDQNQAHQIPVIALTAFAGSEDANRMLSAGFNKHVGKPMQVLPLVDMIADLVKQARSKK